MDAKASTSISITSVTPNNPRWGIDKPTVCGTANDFLSTDYIVINFGDVDSSVRVSPSSSWCVQKPTIYVKEKVGPVDITAKVFDKTGVKKTISSPFSITVKKQLSSVTLNSIVNQYWGNSFGISGTLKDELGIGINAGQITFSGTGKGTHTSAVTSSTGAYSSTGNAPGGPASTGLIMTASFTENSYYFGSSASRNYNTLSHPTLVNLNPIESIPTSTTFLVGGNLIDTVTGKGLGNKLIVLTGDGKANLSNPTTGNLEVKDVFSGIVINSCSYCSEKIMRLSTGAEINIPSLPKFVKLTIQDMGTNTFTMEVTRGDGSKTSSTATGQGLNPGLFSIGHSSGISKIKITGISAGKVGISRIQTLSSIDQIILDVVFSPTSSVPSISFADGAFSSEGISSSVVRPLNPGDTPWSVFASFAGEPGFYDPSPAATPLVNLQTYETLANFGGVGGAPPSSDVELGITSIVCDGAADLDKDSLCDSWEGVGKGVPYTVNGQTLLYNLPGTSTAKRDLLYEADYMTNYQLDPGAKSDVINFFNSLSVAGLLPINLQIFEDEAIPQVSVINIWKDSDTNNGNDAEGIKAARYGKATEHPILSGTQTNSVTNTAATDTVTVSGLSITTPPVATNGKILVVVKMTLASPGISTSTTILPGPVTIAGTGGGLSITGATATVSSISSTIKELKITLPFSSASTVTSSIGTITIPLTIDPTITVSTNPGSPTATTTLLDAKAQAIRYLLIGISSGGRSGAAELKGNDIVMTLGSGFTGTAGSRNEQAGTLVHEMGHNLNLDHGGPANLIGQTTSPPSRTDNCKPNQISV
ncbi:MAG TPA: hypothetical protein VLD64_04115, partial [Nitrosarchaeum sp.]|nr:hypothetical protein [Nitrosarchaeum sp.]